MKDNMIWIMITSILVILIVGLVLIFVNSERLSDNEAFKNEYQQVHEDNIFVYKNAKEIIKILESGTGVVYFGFPECKWCQAYVPYLNDVAKENGIEKIYYFNIREDREKNTKDYKKIVNLTSEYLANDDEGNKRVYVPDVFVVVGGKIVGHNNETSIITEDILPVEYWTEEKIANLKINLKEMLNPLTSKTCTTCN